MKNFSIFKNSDISFSELLNTNRMILALFLFIIISSFLGEIRAQWINVGSPGFSAGETIYLSHAILDKTPYVAYGDAENGQRITVMKFDGTNWVNVGSPGFSQESAGFPSIAFNGNTPYVAFSDRAILGKSTVMKFNGTNWVYVGSQGFSEGITNFTNLAFSDSTPIVAFTDAAHGSKASVMKFDGANWIYVGDKGFTTGAATELSIACIDSTPYLAFCDYGKLLRTSVMKFDGTNWIYVGSAGFSAGRAQYQSLAFSGSVPFVAFRDNANGYKTTVMKFNGTNWVNVGAPGFSVGNSSNQSLAISGNTPFVAYSDNSNKSTVMKFDGTNWIYVGLAGFSQGYADEQKLAFSGSTPFVAFRDVVNGYKITVMKFEDNPLPVELTYFSSLVQLGQITLYWKTSSEINNSGFEIERSVKNDSWSKIGTVTGHGTSNIPNSYSFSDRNLASGKYYYRLKQIDFNGNFEYFNLSKEVTICIPEKFELSQNYPNPFNPSTNINYVIPTVGKVSIKIFDMSGKEIKSLLNEVKTAGYYSIRFNASNLSSGIYYYRLSSADFIDTKKMMLVK